MIPNFSLCEFVGFLTASPLYISLKFLAFCRVLLDDTDSRVAYYSSAFLLKAWILIDFWCWKCVRSIYIIFCNNFSLLQRMMTEKPEKYQHMLQNLVVKAQQVPLYFIMSLPQVHTINKAEIEY